MSVWIEPIFDRTSADVDYANTHRDSPLPLKGMRGYSDLNRISGNMRFVRELFIENGFSIPSMISKDDWIMKDIPRESDIINIKNDLTALRAMISSAETPQVPELPYTHYAKINDIERIIYELRLRTEAVKPSWWMCGEITTGEA